MIYPVKSVAPKYHTTEISTLQFFLKEILGETSNTCQIPVQDCGTSDFKGVMWLNLINGWNPVVEGFALATPQPTLCPDFRDVYLFYPYSRTATTHDNRQLLESKTYKKCDNCELRKHSSYIPYFNAKIWTSEKRLN